MQAAIVSDLSIGYPAHAGTPAFTAVEGISLELPAGSVTALLGESGAGKSTLLRFLAARALETAVKSSQLKQLNGHVQVFGQSLDRLNRKKQWVLAEQIGYLPQDGGAKLNPDLTIGEQLMLTADERYKKFDREPFAERAAALITDCDLPLSVLNEFPHQLSKGQRQRIAVAKSLMLTPKLLILDEPTMGVDARNRPKLIDMLLGYREQHEAAMLIVSHDIGLLEALVDHVLVMQQGSIVGEGDINEIFSNSEHAYVQSLANALRSNAYDEASDE